MPAATNRTRTLLALGLGMMFLLVSFIPFRAPTRYSTPVLEAHESDADGYYAGGVKALAEKDYDRAIADFSRAMKIYRKLGSSTADELRPRFWKPWSRLEPLFQQVWHYRERFVQAMTMRGEAYGNKGQWKEAIADFSEAIRLDERAGLYKLRAAAYRAVGETEKAQWDEKKAEYLSAARSKEAWR